MTTEKTSLADWIDEQLPLKERIDMDLALKDTDPMPFGKYKGKQMINVPADYLDWVIDQPWIEDWPLVKQYIEANKKVISQELTEGGR